MNEGLLFQQLFESTSSTYTYLLADEDSKEAVIIDPVLETVDRDSQLIQDLGLKLKYVLETHIHADHITGGSELRKRFGAKILLSHQAGAEAMDLTLKDGDEISFGRFKLKALETPGHTNGCMSYYGLDRVFTGDTLLIRGSGRTDFQQGSSENLYASVTDKLFKLPPSTVVYPGHDYRGFTSSTIGIEARLNPRLGGKRTVEEFKKTMSELKLSYPKKIDEALPANLKCGEVLTDHRVFHPQVVNGIPEVSVSDVKLNLGRKFRLIDVRRPDEFNNELGHIAGAELKTLGPELLAFLHDNDRTEEIVFICRSGGRSGQATAMALELGYKMPANMVGGMIKWNEESFPVERD